MDQPTPQLLALLKKYSGAEIETFRNFPDVARSGNQFISKEEVDYLVQQGYVEEKKNDSFGQLLALNERAKQLLQNKA
ncbi:MAG TPA: hypothetical protein VFR58_01150 [Flavisolibacter sp.]|nr:hypothetical protein [Flavisolibacter sp.]